MTARGESHAMSPSVIFGRALTRAMSDRGVTCEALAGLLGIQHGRITTWRVGRNVPRHETVEFLAEHLACPWLVALSLKMRQGKCQICGATTIARISRPKRFCSTACNDVYNKRRIYGHMPYPSAIIEHRLKHVQETLHDFCMQCSGGVCYQPSCLIQVAGLGPPLVEERLRVG